MKAYAMIKADDGEHTFIRVGQTDQGFAVDCLHPDNRIERPPLPTFASQEAALEAIAVHWHHPRLPWSG